MKKYKVLLQTVLLSLGLVACGVVKEERNDPAETVERVIGEWAIEQGEEKEEEIEENFESFLENEEEEVGTDELFEQDELLTETEDKEQEETEVEKGQLTITFIGHASMKIKTSEGIVIYVDPNYDGDYTEEADYVLVTHGHGDHLPRPEVKRKKTGKQIYYTDALHNGIYEVYEEGNVRIEAVAAGGNPNHDVNVCVGYLITVDGYTIYHAGDTSKIPQMELLSEREIDYAFYPIDGVYNMGAVEATEAANVVGAKHNIPIHALDDNHTGKADAFTPEGKMTLENGESIILEAR